VFYAIIIIKIINLFPFYTVLIFHNGIIISFDDDDDNNTKILNKRRKRGILSRNKIE
jgi:hypothetical protein